MAIEKNTRTMSKRLRGTIKTWKDDKGYGFIQPDARGTELFFHISDVRNPSIRDMRNQPVTYRIGTGKDARPAAVEVLLTEAPRHGKARTPPRSTGASRAAWLISLVFLGGVTASAAFSRIPMYVPAIYAAASLATYATYRKDKANAQAGQWRTSEATLHTLELLGGWPGALIAQWTIFHKNRKLTYQAVFWIIVLLHMAALAYVIANPARFNPKEFFHNNNPAVEIELL